jgi:IS5 family transposase
VLRSRRVRVDTTVMEADVRYPTDSGLCAHAISRLTRAVRRVKKVGMAAKDKFRDRRRAAGKVIRNVSHSLGRARSRAAVDRLTGEVYRLAKAAVAEAQRVVASAQEELRRRPRPGHSWVARLADEIERARRVIEQTARRLAGEKVIPNRVISLSDLDARPIRRGKPQRPTEFGYKVSIADTAEGLVVSHQVHVGAPADADTLDAALEGVKRTGMRVGTVLADRGYGNQTADRILSAHGITDTVVPRVGAAAPVQQTRAWKRRYRFRAGSEGRISHLKRRHGLGRTRLKGHEGARIWAGFGVLAHNLDRMVALS